MPPDRPPDRLHVARSPADRADRLRRLAAYASIGVATTLVVVKLLTWLATGSVSLLASVIDSAIDAVASLVTLVGVHHALRPADPAHRFGHGKAEPVAALLQSAFIAGSALILASEALNRVVDPRPIANTQLGIAVMAFAAVLTGALVLFQRHVIRRTGSIAISADSVHYTGDLLTNVAVIVALALTELTGALLIDPLFAFGIVAFLLYHAVRLGRGALDVLMDRELPEADRARICRIVLAHPHARGLHDLRTRSAGTAAFIELHLELDGHLSLDRAHTITDQVERQLLRAFPNAEVILHQEPAGIEDERLDQR
ncbi:MAG TPA: cation diffusion facilitator family transporter, partial [Geminicoccaceae bacterium]|nr:cation diffusion facilitator family transporter [Geminicoccaceae bacterium]